MHHLYVVIICEVSKLLVNVKLLASAMKNMYFIHSKKNRKVDYPYFLFKFIYYLFNSVRIMDVYSGHMVKKII